MNKLLLYLLESGLGLLVFYLLYALFLKQETGFQYNRFYLLITPLTAFILPLLELPFLQQPEPLTIFVSEQLAPLTLTAPASVEPAQNFFSWVFFLKLIYPAGTGFCLIQLLRQLYRLHLFARQTQPGRFYWQNIPVHKTNGAQPTFSFGHRIFWDNSQPLSEAEIERILLHESVHVRQHHTLDILYLELLKCIFWFNPLLYFYQKALISTHEYIADAAVLQTTSQETYANLLVKQLLQRMEFSFGNYFNKSLTLKRMHMLKQIHRRPNKLKQVVALPVLFVLVLLLSSSSTSVQHVIEDPAILVGSLSPKYIDNQNQSNDGRISEQYTPPVYPGGKEAMYQYLAQNVKSPAIKSDSYAASITMAFIIDEKGHLNFEEAKTDQAELRPFHEEINRVIKGMPKDWTPAKKDGKPIASRYLFSFDFNKEHPNRKIKQQSNEEATNIISDNKLPTFAARTITVVSYAGTIPARPVKETDKSQNTTQTNQNEPIFTFVEQNPEFPGGLEKMYQFLGSNIKYPKSAKEANLQGLVVAEFIVTKAGKIIEPKIVKSLSPDTDAEAKRVIGLMPAWNPGKQNGKPVNVKYTLPLRFSLDANEQKEVKPAKTGYINWAKPLQDNC